jgi:hypothetical protein
LQQQVEGSRLRGLVAQAVITVLGVACLAAVIITNDAWLERHILPEFFQPRAEQQRAQMLVHGVLLALAVVLWAWVRPRVGRWAARKSARQIAADVLPTLLAVVLALVAGEFLLRNLPWFSTHQLPTQREPLRRRDPVTGWAYQEARVGRGVLGGRTIDYAFDGAGHRVRSAGEAVDYARPSVLFVGESIISGHGVAYDESLPARVGARLSLQPADLAVGGFATDQMYLRFKAEWPRYREPRAVVILFMPSLFHRNLEHDRPHLDPSLVWRPASDDWRLVQIARRLVPYRSDRELEDGFSMTRRALGAMVGMAREKGAVPLILVPELTPETAEEARIRGRVLAGLPYLKVAIDPAWHVAGNRHPDARADARLAEAVAAYIETHQVQDVAPRAGSPAADAYRLCRWSYGRFIPPSASGHPARGAGVGVGDGDGKGVGGVGGGPPGGGQQPGDHPADLRLVGAAGADHGLLDHRGGVLGHQQAGAGGHDHRHGPGVAQLQGRLGVAVHEGLLDRRLVRAVGGDDGLDPGEQAEQALGERQAVLRRDHPVGHVAEPRAVTDDHAPARAAQAGIQAQDSNGRRANRGVHRLFQRTCPNDEGVEMMNRG